MQSARGAGDALPEAAAKAFVIYRDDTGQPHVVQSMGDVPAPYRAAATKVTMPPLKDAPGILGFDADDLGDILRAAREQLGAQAPPPAKQRRSHKHGRGHRKTHATEQKNAPLGLDLPSIGIGAAVGLAVGILIARLFRGRIRLLLMVVGLAGLLLGGMAYLGWIRSQAGLPSGHIATPGDILDDAKKAAAAMKRQRRAQRKALKLVNEVIRPEPSEADEGDRP